MDNSAKRLAFSVLKNPIVHAAIGVYVGLVLVVYGVSLLRFRPTLEDAIRSGLSVVQGRIEATGTRSFFGGDEFRFQIAGQSQVFTVFPGTLLGGAMAAVGSEVAIVHTQLGHWVVELKNLSQPGSPELVNKAKALRELEESLALSLAKALVALVTGLAFLSSTYWLRKLGVYRKTTR